MNIVTANKQALTKFTEKLIIILWALTLDFGLYNSVIHGHIKVWLWSSVLTINLTFLHLTCRCQNVISRVINSNWLSSFFSNCCHNLIAGELCNLALIQHCYFRSMQYYKAWMMCYFYIKVFNVNHSVKLLLLGKVQNNDFIV